MILSGRGTAPAFRITASRTIFLTLPGYAGVRLVDPSTGAVGAFNATSGETHRIGLAYAFVDMNSGHFALNRPLSASASARSLIRFATTLPRQRGAADGGPGTMVGRVPQ
jgi:hypothetical protein